MAQEEKEEKRPRQLSGNPGRLRDVPQPSRPKRSVRGNAGEHGELPGEK
jgi:hypothetical protein